MPYAVKKTLLGKLRVHYHCPHCNAELESALEEAGQEFPCPTCQRALTVPGHKELQQQQDDRAAELRRDDEAKQVAEADKVAAMKKPGILKAATRAARVVAHELSTPPPDAPEVPEYNRIKNVSFALYFLGIIALLISPLVFLDGMDPMDSDIYAVQAKGINIMGSAVGMFFSGLMCVAASAALEALRDIARNSFRR